jgi:NitT/TauT family transport system substrate-binding protein
MSTAAVRQRARALVAFGFLAAAAAVAVALKPPEAAATGNADKITIAVTGATVTQDVPFLAASKGYFEKRGLDVDVRLLPSSQAVPAIASGQVQFIVGAEPGGSSITSWASANASNRQKTVKLLGYWQPKAGGLDVVVRPGISSIAALRGKTVGVPSAGGASAILLNLVLSRAGKLTSRDVRVVSLGTLGAVVAAFNTGNISAMSATEPLTTQVLEGTPGARVAFSMDKWNWVLGGIAGYMPWVSKNPGQTVKVLAALNEALVDYHRNPEDAKAVVGKIGNITDRSQLDRAYRSSIPYITSRVQPISEVAMRAVLQGMKKNGTPTADPNRWREQVDNRYGIRAAKVR